MPVPARLSAMASAFHLRSGRGPPTPPRPDHGAVALRRRGSQLFRQDSTAQAPVGPMTRWSRLADQPGRATSCSTSQPSCSSWASTPAVRRCATACRRQNRAFAEGGTAAATRPAVRPAGPCASPARHPCCAPPAAQHRGRRRPPGPTATATASRRATAPVPCGGGAGRWLGPRRPAGCSAGRGRAGPERWFRSTASRSPRPAPGPVFGSGAGPPERRSLHRPGRNGRPGHARGACRPSRSLRSVLRCTVPPAPDPGITRMG
jgi:hypothetical protein